jgi:VWFA-related protein
MVKAWLALFAISVLNAQTIRVETREVIVDVTVTDSKNVAVRDLEKRNFTIFDEGKARVIDGFEVNSTQPPLSALPATPLRPASGSSSDAPKTVHSTAIILDEVNTFFEDAAQARQSVVDLMAKVPADERISLYVIARKQGLLLIQDYTTDRDVLKRSFAKHFPSGMMLADSGHFYADQPLPPGAKPPMTDEEKVALWRENNSDARLSLQKLAEQLALAPGRKSLFWVTNGFNPWVMGLGNRPSSPVIASLDMEKPAWEKTFTILNEANVAVSVVDSRGLYRASNPVTGTIAIMQEVADRTGGKAYYGRNDLDGAIAEGIAASRVTYSLRFHLADDERDKKYHALKVKVDRPGLQLYYRQGYYAGGTEMPVDLVAGKIEGQAMETRAASGNAAPLDADMQLPYFYAGTNRANVHLTADLSRAGLQGQVEIVGIALRPDGSEAARFADTASADGHYAHMFMIGAGTYVFRLEVGGGTGTVSQKEVPLQIEPWNSGSFGIGGIALSREARPAQGPAMTGSLIAGGKEFVAAAGNRFHVSERVYFYTEVYEQGDAGGLTMQYRVLERNSGEVKLDSGMAGAGGFVRPGNPVVPFATVLPVAKLAPGSYRLEVRAGHSSGADPATRTIDFEVTE